MKLHFAAIAFSATLVACGGGSGDGDLDNSDIDDTTFIGGGIDEEDDFDLTDNDIDADNLVDGSGGSADGCEGNSGTDPDSSTANWNDNCRLQVGGEHRISSYTQGVQRIVFCRGHDNGLDISEINTFADGDFGPITQEQVRNFQTAEGIASDGIVGPETWEALQAVLDLLDTNVTDQRDSHGVLPGTCESVVQFYQENDGVELGGWTMAQTPGSPDTIPFSVGLPY